MIRFLAVSFTCLALLSPFAARAAAVDQWLALREASYKYDFYVYDEFLRKHPDWPDNITICMRAEEAMERDNPDTRAVIAYFSRQLPVTDKGRLNYIMALTRAGEGLRAAQFLRETWGKGYYDSDTQDRLMERRGDQLTADDHKKRLDTLLWQNNLARAEKAAGYLSGTPKRIGLVRIDLQRGKSQAASEAENLIRSGVVDNGLSFDLGKYYLRQERDDAAARTFGNFNGSRGDYAPRWWRERALLARRALERGDYARAYKLAAAHKQTSPAELADAEWLAGWLATTRLRNPQDGLKHFERMYHNVQTPISIARAAYWAGLACGQMRQEAMAINWYKLAAQHMNTFYGQMAAYALNTPKESFAAFFARSKSAPSSQHVPADMIDAARTLHRMKRDRERDMFLQKMIDITKEKGFAQEVVGIARSVNSPKMALVAAKAAYEKDYLIRDALFPVISVPKSADVEKALALGIIRQESQFDSQAVSPANARGLMQILPGTAEHTARQCAIPYRSAAELFLPQQNMALGQAYLGRMLARYDNFVPLAAAAYNAGPGNVDKWLAKMGDPRNDPHSWVDWVERIPFYETRNYVQRVWEGYSVYRSLPN